MIIKRQPFIVICSFVIMGVCLLLIAGCKKDEKKDNSNPANLALMNIPAGTFIMGSPIIEVNHGFDENVHQVTLSAFRMSKYEITS
jgi:formylglycine-generating enzyme required for sulfatase activity